MRGLRCKGERIRKGRHMTKYHRTKFARVAIWQTIIRPSATTVLLTPAHSSFDLDLDILKMSTNSQPWVDDYSKISQISISRKFDPGKRARELFSALDVDGESRIFHFLLNAYSIWLLRALITSPTIGWGILVQWLLHALKQRTLNWKPKMHL